MKKRNDLLLALLCLFMSCNQPVTSQEQPIPARQVPKDKPGWILVTSGKDGSAWYIKSTVESKDGVDITIWVQEEKTDMTINSLMIYDCSHKTSYTKRMIRYDGNGHLISDTGEINGKWNKWKQELPDTVGETIRRKVCESF